MWKILIKSKWLANLLVLLLLNMAICSSYYNVHAALKPWATMGNYAPNEANKSNKKIKSNTELMEEKIKNLVAILREDESKSISKTTLIKLRDDIKAIDREIMKEFSNKELRQQNVSSKILARHFESATAYQNKMAALLDMIDGIISEEDISPSSFHARSKENARKEISENLEEEYLQKEYILPAVNDLPKRQINYEAGEPGGYRSIIPAYQYTINGFQTQDSYQVKTADLGETIEVQFTPEIKELARDLDYDPVKIYEYIKNNFDYEPYYGSVRGALFVVV